AVAVPAEGAVRSPSFGRRPPQLETYALVPSGETFTPKGAIPTGISSTISPFLRSTTPKALFRDMHTYAVFSSGESATPQGNELPPPLTPSAGAAPSPARPSGPGSWIVRPIAIFPSAFTLNSFSPFAASVANTLFPSRVGAIPVIEPPDLGNFTFWRTVHD